ncbi:MAG: acetate--CoA ligase family protein [Paracoccaceae bacterium]|nr:acetate--CoA ligase family protein [Paracoccaceae bacterium]
MANRIETGDAACRAHRLAPMFEAQSVAVVGVSPRAGSIGHATMRAVLGAGFDGEIHLVNPRHDLIEGRTCAGSIADLDQPPDLAILNLGAARIEAGLAEVISARARSAVIFDPCHGDAADGSPLTERLRAMAREAGIPVCGGNGMGFIDVTRRLNASFYPSDHLKPGGITLIAHSGSVFTVLAMNDPRYRFDLLVSPGTEIGAGIDEYIGYALTRPTTKVIAVFMEGARNPGAFRAALERAEAQGVPVVVCKVGRTEQSARAATTHTGAMTGSDSAYRAVMEAANAIPVETVDQLMNTAMLLSQDRGIGPGGIGLVTDSGGLREAAMDRADRLGVPLAQFSPSLAARLADHLPPPLTPTNPLDCAGPLADGFEEVFEGALRTLGAAPEIAMLGYECDMRDDHRYSERLADLMRTLPQITDQPCFGYSSFAQTHNRALASELADRGLPVINGLDAMLEAAGAALRWRDGRAVRRESMPIDRSLATRVQSRLADGPLGEADGLAIFAEFGLPVIPATACASENEALAAAQAIGFPVVLKSAKPGLAHKSDAGGVILGLADEAALAAAYRAMAARLGPRVLVQAMAGQGVELAFGCVHDPDFGPIVMASAGGTLVEFMADRRYAPAPFGSMSARRMIQGLSVARLLAGVRGAPPADIEGAAQALSHFSMMCAALREAVTEIDANPVIVGPAGAAIVDALVVPAQ